MELILYDWAPSPFCIKVRAILDHKRLRYRRVPVLGRAIVDVRRRGGIGKVPALDIDGTLVTDSTDIAHALERLAPEPAILPADARSRALCHALEDWADEALYFIGLYFQWVDPRGAAMVPAAFGPSVLGRVAHRWFRHIVVGQVRGQGTARKPAARVRADLDRALDAIDALLADAPFLLGDAPLLCDFALLGQLLYLSRPPTSAEALRAHPAIGAYLERMRELRAH
jgi:glutathione S-transferase